MCGCVALTTKPLMPYDTQAPLTMASPAVLSSIYTPVSTGVPTVTQLLRSSTEPWAAEQMGTVQAGRRRRRGSGSGGEHQRRGRLRALNRCVLVVQKFMRPRSPNGITLSRSGRGALLGRLALARGVAQRLVAYPGRGVANAPGGGRAAGRGSKAGRRCRSSPRGLSPSTRRRARLQQSVCGPRLEPAPNPQTPGHELLKHPAV
jgi:hypothetical protein